VDRQAAFAGTGDPPADAPTRAPASSVRAPPSSPIVYRERCIDQLSWYHYRAAADDSCGRRVRCGFPRPLGHRSRPPRDSAASRARATPGYSDVRVSARTGLAHRPFPRLSPRRPTSASLETVHPGWHSRASTARRRGRLRRREGCGQRSSVPRVLLHPSRRR
jgi:hypothetical protein